MFMIRGLACLSMWLLLGSAAASAQEKKKPLAVEDLYLMESVKSPALFPKEEKLVYERVWIDAQTKLERHALWLVTGKRENRKPLEQDEADGRNPVVSPDGEWVAFLSSRRFPAGAKQIPKVPAYSDAGVDIWLYHVKSAQVMPLGGADRPWGRVFHDGFYGRVAFSADSKHIVFVADDGGDARSKEEIENDVEIVRADQGEGYTGYGAAQVWIAEIQSLKRKRRDDDKPFAYASGSVVRLTKDDIWYGDPNWSPDGKSLVCVANKTKDRESVRFSINKNFDLYLIDVATKKQTQLTSNPGPDVSPRWSPDGKQIAYLSSPRKGPHRDVLNVGIVALGEGGPKTRLLMVTSPFPQFDNCWDNDQIIRFRKDRGNQIYWDLKKNASHDPSSTKDQPRDWDDSRRFADLKPTADELENNRFRTGQIEVRWKNEEFEIGGVFTIPPLEVAKRPYKLIVYPHGGPHGHSTFGFDFTVNLFAAHGYAVFQPNFRGSSGYGKKFLDADRLDLGGGDMRDILTGIDMLVKGKHVDPKRQFVYGTSYGGFMTSWLVGHTHQFRAAVAQNAVTDMNMMYGLSDLQSWTTWELGGLPWEQAERYKKHSPLTYADKIKTPTLILHARDDRRCPLPMGKAFHQALLANEVPTQMVIYPNEGHGIRSPRHREDVYRRVLGWFAKYDVAK